MIEYFTGAKGEGGMKIICLFLLVIFGFPIYAQEVNLYVENTTPDSRYNDNKNGTVTDIYTGLMWMQCSEGQVWEMHNNVGHCTGDASLHTWDEALKVANEKTFGNYSDWRLPDIKELASLVAVDRYNPSINSEVFPATPAASFWSGSPNSFLHNNSNRVSFYYGHEDYQNRDVGAHLRLVRSE